VPEIQKIPTMFDSPEVDFAISAVREAGLLVRRVQRELVSPGITKQDRSPVTVADFATQAVVAKRLGDRFPEHLLIGEESTAVLRTEAGRELVPQIARFVGECIPDATEEQACEWIDRGNLDKESSTPPQTFWTLDPVDGTKGFLRGDQYAVALALVADGEPQIGVLGCPQLVNAHQPEIGGAGSLVVAVRGKGTWFQPLAGESPKGSGNGDWQRLTVSTRSDLADARLMRSVESAHTNTGRIGAFISELGITAPSIPMDSQAKYAVLAAAQGDLLVRLISSAMPDYREMIWDQAAGSIVVTEAGGRVSDLDGKRLDFSQGRTLAKNRGVLGTNGLVHEAALEALRSIGA